MSSFLITIAAGVVVVIVTAGWFWSRVARTGHATRRAESRLHRLFKLRLLAFRRARAVLRARAEGVSVVTGVRESNPAVVTFDGIAAGKLYAYRDPQRLSMDVRAGRVHHLATRCCGRPPRVGDRLRP